MIEDIIGFHGETFLKPLRAFKPLLMNILKTVNKEVKNRTNRIPANSTSVLHRNFTAKLRQQRQSDFLIYLEGERLLLRGYSLVLIFNNIREMANFFSNPISPANSNSIE